jgi:hypothetical protein
VDLPDDFAAALDADRRARAFFDGLSNSLQRYHVGNVTGTTNPDTRQRRIDKAIDLFLAGKQRSLPNCTTPDGLFQRADGHGAVARTVGRKRHHMAQRERPPPPFERDPRFVRAFVLVGRRKEAQGRRGPVLWTVPALASVSVDALRSGPTLSRQRVA